jgi:hypothetical protein
VSSTQAPSGSGPAARQALVRLRFRPGRARRRSRFANRQAQAFRHAPSLPAGRIGRARGPQRTKDGGATDAFVPARTRAAMTDAQPPKVATSERGGTESVFSRKSCVKRGGTQRKTHQASAEACADKEPPAGLRRSSVEQVRFTRINARTSSRRWRDHKTLSGSPEPVPPTMPADRKSSGGISASERRPFDGCAAHYRILARQHRSLRPTTTTSWSSQAANHNPWPINCWLTEDYSTKAVSSHWTSIVRILTILNRGCDHD